MKKMNLTAKCFSLHQEKESIIYITSFKDLLWIFYGPTFSRIERYSINEVQYGSEVEPQSRNREVPSSKPSRFDRACWQGNNPYYRVPPGELKAVCPLIAYLRSCTCFLSMQSCKIIIECNYVLTIVILLLGGVCRHLWSSLCHLCYGRTSRPPRL